MKKVVTLDVYESINNMHIFQRAVVYSRPIPITLIPIKNPALNCIKNSSHPGKIVIYRENERIGFVLPKQIHNNIN